MIKTHQSFRRLLGFTTALSMAFPALTPAFAQDAAGATPPARVGQITSLSGSVSFNGSGSGGWAAAADNYPVTTGDSLYTQDNSRAGIALDASQITLASDTEIQVTGLDDRSFAATLSQGELAFAINYLQPGQILTISTPRGAVSINRNGQYAIAAGDASTPTVVNVYEGAATVADPGISLQVAAGQAAILSGADQTTAQLGQAQQDSFTSSALAQNTTPPPSYAPAVINQMTGVSELNQYGSWQQSPQYGAIWYPAVSNGWAPYREGHWANIQPWGWTWVESEPWGFAPFHYGRWVDTDDRWGWAPASAYDPGSYGPSYQPVYAPAVVGFFGVALAAGITAAVLSSGSVGWVPLAPGEAYYPTYRAPPGYIRQINLVNVRNVNQIHTENNYYYGSNFSPDRMANRRAATFVPGGVMSRGEHVGGFAHAPRPDELSSARPIDTGFGHPGGQAAFRLPEPGRPMAEARPGAAPRASDFGNRHAMPPATLSRGPFTGQPGATPAASRPGFGTAPGYHAPPALPSPGQHPGILPPGNFHPTTLDHGAVQPQRQQAAPFHPQQQQRSAPGPQAGHEQAQQRAPAQSFHPAAQAYHAPEQQFHPQQAAPRPMQARPQMAPRPMEARPQMAPHVEQRPEAPRNNDDHGGHGGHGGQDGQDNHH